jgi:hypothetical protein
MANVVRANLSAGVKAGVFGKGLGDAQTDIAASELDSTLATDADVTAIGNIKHYAAGDVNVAATNPVTVTGIAVGDVVLAIFKDTAGADLSSVAVSDATVGAGTLTFGTTSFGATDGIVVLFRDLT